MIKSIMEGKEAEERGATTTERTGGALYRRIKHVISSLELLLLLFIIIYIVLNI